MLWKADRLSQELSCTVTAVLIGWRVRRLVDDLSEKVDRLLVVEDEALQHYNTDLWKKILHDLIGEYHPLLTLIGHTTLGLDLAPALAVKTGFPLVTDCLDLFLENNHFKATRELYAGKVYAKVAFKKSDGYLVTIRPGMFPSIFRVADYGVVGDLFQVTSALLDRIQELKGL